jgi:hypothetical protein
MGTGEKRKVGLVRAARAFVGRHARAWKLLREARRQDATMGLGAPRVVFMPSNNWETGASANFRAFALAREMSRLPEGQAWRSLCLAPHLSLEQRVSVLHKLRPDVIVLQSARHAANEPRHYKSIAPCVMDLDDAEYEVPALFEKFDRAVRDSAMVLVGSQVLADWCLPRNANTHVVWTSNPHTPPPPVPQAQRLPVVCWAQNGWDKYVEEGDAVRAIVQDMHRRLGSKPGVFDFRIIGVADLAPWEKFTAPLRAAGITCSSRGYLPYDQFLAELSQVAVGLHVLIDTHIYSRGKSFGKLLSYSTSGVAIVATNNLETPRAFTDGLNARLCDTHEHVAQAACDLLQDPAQRQRLGDAAQRLMEEKFASRVIAKQVSSLLRTLIKPHNTLPS